MTTGAPIIAVIALMGNITPLPGRCVIISHNNIKHTPQSMLPGIRIR